MFKHFILLVAAIILLITSNFLFAETIKNIDYAGTGETEHMLNIYKPDGDGPFPVVLYYTGLAFSWSDAKTDGGMASSYNSAGFAVVGPNLSGGGSGSHKATYPTQIQELKATVRFLRAHADEYDLDPNFIGVMGFSSGAWNTAILATTGDIDEYTVGSTTMNLEGDFGGNLEFSSRVQAGWASAPPTDFAAMDGCGSVLDHGGAGSPEGSIIGGALADNPDKVTLANPITFVSLDDPPLYLRHGSSDNVVPTCQSELLWEAMEAVGNEKDMDYTAVGGGHSPSFNGSLEFFKEALENNKEGCLDPDNEQFDPLATYCSTDDCCNITALATASVPAKDVLSIGYSKRINKTAETISILSTGRHTLQVFNALGAKVMSESGIGKTKYSIGSIKSGVYFVTVSVEGITKTKKIVRF